MAISGNALCIFFWEMLICEKCKVKSMAFSPFLYSIQQFSQIHYFEGAALTSPQKFSNCTGSGYHTCNQSPGFENLQARKPVFMMWEALAQVLYFFSDCLNAFAQPSWQIFLFSLATTACAFIFISYCSDTTFWILVSHVSSGRIVPSL